MKRDSVAGTFTVAAVLCICCSVLVSGAAVGLRARQEANKEQFQRKNILLAAGFIKDGQSVSPKQIDEFFANIETRIIDLDTGEVTDAVDLETYDQKKAARDPKLSVETEGLTGFVRREKYSRVYLVKDGSKLSKIVLPVYGKGLWSTLYGYVAIESDLKTIAGLTFYEHKETPGLGGEVDNPNWKAQWTGKKTVDSAGTIRIEVIKGTVDPAGEGSEHQVDGLSGATITSRGVSNLVQYWVSENGFGKYLARF
jgi:Na+-transporting NADH:ubiquinone oxidoreductase subunit C